MVAAKPTNSCSHPVSASSGGWSTYFSAESQIASHFVEVDGFEQVLAGREVAVERPDPDPCPAATSSRVAPVPSSVNSSCAAAMSFS